MRNQKKNSKAISTDIDNDALLRGDIPKDYTDHLHDLRIRLITALLFLIAVFAASVYFSNLFTEWIQLPLKLHAPSVKLKYDYMGESIMIKLKIALVISLFINIPVFIILIWSYIKPAIDISARMFSRILLIFGVLLFYTGSFFSYRFITPYTVKLIETFALEDVPNQINFTNYFNFLLIMIVTLGGIFELPVIIAVLTKIGIITPKILSSQRKYALLIIWIAAALITPPDVLTQSMIAIPLMFLYEISILIASLIYKFSRKRD